MNELLKKFENVFEDNWKDHAGARVPSFDEERINVFEFNHDTDEPLRVKYYTVTIDDNAFNVYWLCQESWYDLTGMKQEFKRWAKYWLDRFTRSTEKDEDLEKKEIRFKVTVADRDGYKKSTFTFKLTV